MPQVTRKGVFETNSSSSHSIHIEPGQFDMQAGVEQLLPVDHNGAVEIFPGEFGWEQETFYGTPDKASYLLVWAKQYGTPNDLDMLKRVLERCLNREVRFCTSDDKWGFGNPDGYIDHNSGDVGEEAFASEEAMESFLFNTRSYVETDNDNH